VGDTAEDIPGAVNEMLEVLRIVAAHRVADRAMAVRYTEKRQRLLDSRLRPDLPGFLLQCSSLSKFHDFITLYAPRVEARIQFIDQAFAPFLPAKPDARNGDIFADDDDF
jgi:hypothetical protein